MTIERLQQDLQAAFSEDGVKLYAALGELTLEVPAQAHAKVHAELKQNPSFNFEQLIDLCGVDYSDYRNEVWSGPRFAVVTHLLSLKHNLRVRVKTFCPDDEFPVLPSISEIWSSANWFEREAFDLFGIMFTGHNDLRRILTDYGFIGHPFRKDFPTHGHVEMRYDPEQKRVIYQPVSIELREITPRVVREDHYAGLG